MKRVILDTNIYGEMVIDTELEDVKKLIMKKILVYGSDVIRKEIRRAPRWITSYPKNLKMDLIRLYDSLVKHTIIVTPEVIKLADDYYLAYNHLGGRLPKSSINNDLLIVACASLKGLDIVISNDKDTMIDAEFQKIYNLVNKLAGKRNPDFLNYEEFKIMLRRLPL